jgi:hypothetical protein
MPTAILKKAADYTNKGIFGDKKVLKGSRESVTEDQADHLEATGLFEIVEDNAPPKRGGVTITTKTAKPVKNDAGVEV